MGGGTAFFSFDSLSGQKVEKSDPYLVKRWKFYLSRKTLVFLEKKNIYLAFQLKKRRLCQNREADRSHRAPGDGTKQRKGEAKKE